MKDIIIKVLIFVVFFSLGASLRFTLFFTLQKKIVEDQFFYKDIKEMKGGANTPQEAWIKYLEALEKGNIDEALMYVWGPERETQREFLLDKKRNDNLSKFLKQYRKSLKELPPIYYLDEDEKWFTYLTNEEISDNFKKLENSTDTDIKKLYEGYRNSPIKEAIYELIPNIIFKYNSFTKKWFIKSIR